MDVDLNEVGSDLLRLAMTPGPTQAAVQISCPKATTDFPIFLEVRRLVEKLNLRYEQHLGNLVIYEGIEEVDRKKLVREIRRIPVTLGAHLDEITYLVTNSKVDNDYLLMPICAPPSRTNLVNPESKIVGFRYENDGSLSEVGSGSFKVKYIENKEKLAYFRQSYEEIKDDASCSKRLREAIASLFNEMIQNTESGGNSNICWKPMLMLQSVIWPYKTTTTRKKADSIQNQRYTSRPWMIEQVA